VGAALEGRLVIQRFSTLSGFQDEEDHCNWG